MRLSKPLTNFPVNSGEGSNLYYSGIGSPTNFPVNSGESSSLDYVLKDNSGII